ncbi:hypothetical protein AX16_005992 [Volvariella volvacea WC 439]|nr:hypothetical protein AX16_005992 [Volvariella volvacea WC 439]
MDFSLEDIEPVLPLELEREIFLLAASTDFDTAQTLFNVAQRVRVWIEPYVYMVIMQGEGTTIRPKGHKTPQTPPLESYAKHIRHLLLGYTLDPDIVDVYLNACTGVSDLALWSHTLNIQMANTIGRLPSLRRLSTNLEKLFRPVGANPSAFHVTFPTPDFSHPLFANLTHLEITNPCKEWTGAWDGLASIPNLTHLAFDFEYYPAVVEGALTECMSLQVLVLVNGLLDPNGDFLREVSPVIAADPRMVALYVKAWDHDWESGAWGNGDFWLLAEEIVAEQRKPREERSIVPPFGKYCAPRTWL